MYISISSYTYTYRYIHIHINIYIHTSSTATTTMTHPHIHRGGEALETKESQQHQKQAEPHHSPTTTGGGGTMTHPQGGGGVGDAAPYIYICIFDKWWSTTLPFAQVIKQFHVHNASLNTKHETSKIFTIQRPWSRALLNGNPIGGVGVPFQHWYWCRKRLMVYVGQNLAIVSS